MSDICDFLIGAGLDQPFLASREDFILTLILELGHRWRALTRLTGPTVTQIHRVVYW